MQFETADDADTAIAKFTGYQYGGRPLGLSFVKYLNADGNANGDAHMDGNNSQGLTQDQIM